MKVRQTQTWTRCLGATSIVMFTALTVSAATDRKAMTGTACQPEDSDTLISRDITGIENDHSTSTVGLLCPIEEDGLNESGTSWCLSDFDVFIYKGNAISNPIACSLYEMNTDSAGSSFSFGTKTTSSTQGYKHLDWNPSGCDHDPDEYYYVLACDLTGKSSGEQDDGSRLLSYGWNETGT